ncbi:MAG: CHRD domain-containing protein [Anaerolineae bacterium]|nr:CHRD domain-containing protein [Anaerolineae bacterium]
MRSNFMRLSASMLIMVLLAVLAIGGAGGRVNPAVAAQATTGGAGSAMACPQGSTAAQPGMMATKAAQMMGTMTAATAAAGGAQATMAATMMSTMGAGGGVATAAANAMQEVPASGTMMDAGCLFAVSLSGAQEAPGPGDPNGSGSALVLVNAQTNMVCYDFSRTSDITLPATAAHIHQAPPGQAGPVVVPFGNPPNSQGVGNGCVMNVPANIVSAILSNPANFYVNVHTSDFPNGAIRGQLAAQ